MWQRVNPSEQDGQIFPALLLAGMFGVAIAFALAQLASSSDQRSQTQTAADAGALAAAGALRHNFAEQLARLGAIDSV